MVDKGVFKWVDCSPLLKRLKHAFYGIIIVSSIVGQEFASSCPYTQYLDAKILDINQRSNGVLCREGTLMAKVDKPNYTQIPNIILDNIDKFSNTEFKILLLICRKTFGWHKEKDKISYSQLIKTGLGKNTIPRAINSLKDNGYIIQTGSPHSGYSYELSIIGLTPLRVQDIPTMGTKKPEIIPTMGTTKESLNKLSKEKKSDESPITPEEKEFKVQTQKLVDYIYQIHKQRKTLPMGKLGMDKFINANRSTAKTILTNYQKDDINEVLIWIKDHDYWEDNFNHLTQFPTVYGQYKNMRKKDYNHA